MPDPTRAQFDAAAKKVLESAPPGLSKEEFYALIDQELARATSGVKPATALDMASGRVGRNSYITDTPQTDSFLTSIAKNPMLQGAAHPQGLGDVLSLTIPAGVEGAVGMLKGFTSAAKRAAAESPTIRSFPRKLMGTLYQDAAKTPIVDKLDFLSPELSAQHDFNKLPRYKQLEEMSAPPKGAAGVVETTRSSGPPARIGETVPTSFNEKPLWQQMEEMSNVGPTPPQGRQGMAVPGHRTPPQPTPRHVPNPEGPTPKLEDVLEKALIRAKESPMESVAAPEWHADVPAGSPEAKAANALHRYEGEMDAGYRRRLADDKGETTVDVLAKLGLLGGSTLTADVIRRLTEGSE